MQRPISGGGCTAVVQGGFIYPSPDTTAANPDTTRSSLYQLPVHLEDCDCFRGGPKYEAATEELRRLSAMVDGGKDMQLYSV